MDRFEADMPLDDPDKFIPEAERTGFAVGYETAQLSYGGNLEEEAYKSITGGFKDYSDNKDAYDAWMNVEGVFGDSFNRARHERATEDGTFMLDANNNVLLGENGTKGTEILFDMNAIKGALLAKKNGYTEKTFNNKYTELAKEQADKLSKDREGTSTAGYIGGILAGHIIQPEIIQEIATSPAKIMGTTILKGMGKAFMVEGAVGLVGEISREQRIREHMERANLEYTLWDSIQQITIGAGLAGGFRAIGSGVTDVYKLGKIRKEIPDATDKEIFTEYMKREDYKLVENTNTHINLMNKAEDDMNKGRVVDISDHADIDISTKTDDAVEEVSLSNELTLRDEANGYPEQVTRFEDEFQAPEIKADSKYAGMADDTEGDELIREMSELDPEIKAEMEAIEAEFAQPTKEPVVKEILPEVTAIETKPLRERLSGDDLLDAEDFIEDLKEVGTNITDDGMVTIYHRTSKENAEAIISTGQMKTKEPDIFFSTSKEGQAEGYGDAIIEMQVPIEDMRLDDMFAEEAHVAVIHKDFRKPKDISAYSPKIDKGLQVTKITTNITERAKALQGNKYIWGGTDLKSGADCSGFVQSIHKEQGISLPRTAWGQAKGTQGKNIAFNDMQIGDTIYFKPSTTGKKYAPVTHTGIITGMKDGKYIMTHAKGKKYGTVTEELSPGYIDRFYSAKRFTEEGVPGEKVPTPKEVEGRVVIDEEITPEMEQTLLKQEELDTIEFNKLEEAPKVEEIEIPEVKEAEAPTTKEEMPTVEEAPKVTKETPRLAEAKKKPTTFSDLAKISKKDMTKVPPETVGALAGFEQDEEGYWTYNVAKGALGAAGVHIAGKAFTSKKMKEFVMKHMKEYI